MVQDLLSDIHERSSYAEGTMLDMEGTSIPLLSKALDAYVVRQRVIADNIANSETPGFRRKEVRFEEELRKALGKKICGRRTDPRHLPVGKPGVKEVRPKIVSTDDPQVPNGVNNVDMEREMVQLTKNYLKYISAMEVLRRRLRDLKLSVEGRGGM
ncbi:MAG: flagellar basal body rod protein FlgB [Candidatus Latescibacterota bacterium]|nr:MAG: flagellar basal body rod protein FlgB [Candidatus Latescibacterota bacterium]